MPEIPNSVPYGSNQNTSSGLQQGRCQCADHPYHKIGISLISCFNRIVKEETKPESG